MSSLLSGLWGSTPQAPVAQDAPTVSRLSAIGTRLYNACPTPGEALVKTAKAYTGTVDVLGAVATVGCECGKAIGAGAYQAWTQGWKGTLLEGAKSAFGVNEFVAAKDVLFQDKKMVEVAAGQVTKKGQDVAPVAVVQEEDFPLSERIGAAIGHTVNGVTRAATSGILGTGYAVGTGLNLVVGSPEICTVDTMHEAAQVIATGVNTGLEITARVAWNYGAPIATTAAKLSWSALSSACSFAMEHPLILGSAGATYVAAKEVINCSESTSKIGRIAHGTIAATFAVGAAAFPFVAPLVL